MHPYLKQIHETVNFLRKAGIHQPTIGIVLGTGLGQLIQHITIEKKIPYHKIPNFPVATVEFHNGQLIIGTIGDKNVIAMQGRFHYYEGYSMQQITFPIRVMKELGIKNLLLSNAAGGINNTYKKGDLVLLDDHINLLPENPLRGLSDPAFGLRFPDMSRPYSKNINQIFLSVASRQNITLHKGIYAAVEGPNLETRAEYRYIRGIGADVVGMSTVPEVIVANQVGIPCAAVSVVTDECDPDNLQPVDISEIIEVAGKADEKLSSLFAEVIKRI